MTLPAWMAAVEGTGPGRAAGLGLALAAGNPKNLALTVAAAASVAQTGVEGTDTVIAVAVYVLLGSITVLGAVLYHLVLGDRATATLAGVRAFMTANNDVIIMIVLLVFGAKLIGDGLSDLGG